MGPSKTLGMDISDSSLRNRGRLDADFTAYLVLYRSYLSPLMNQPFHRHLCGVPLTQKLPMGSIQSKGNKGPSAYIDLGFCFVIYVCHHSGCYT
jgi:hypothetical protein